MTPDNGPDIDFETLWNSIEDTAIDNQAMENAEKALLDEPGYYVSQDGMTVDPDIADDGRRQYIVKGMATNENGRQTRIFLRLSPDYRPKLEPDPDRPGTFRPVDPEKPDWRHQLWLKARRAYITANGGEPPATFGQVSEYLRTYPVRYLIRHTPGDDRRPPGTMVVNIAAAN